MRKLTAIFVLFAFAACTQDFDENSISVSTGAGKATVVHSSEYAANGRMVVKFRPESEQKISAASRAGSTTTGIESIDMILNDIGAISIEPVFVLTKRNEAAVKRAGLHLWYELTFDESADLDKVADRLAAVSDISVVQFDVRVKKNFDRRPVALDAAQKAMAATRAGSAPFNDPQLPMQWHMINDGDKTVTTPIKAGADVNCRQAWELCAGDPSIVVAVIDDGFDLSHPELQGKIVSPYNAVTHTSNVTPSASGHGTHVAATAVGNAGNGEGTSGIAPNCKLMPIQVADAQGNMATSAILDGVIYAINNGADVVNMSLGIYFGPFVQFVPVYIQKNFRANMFLEEERVWNHLFNIARQRGMIFVIAGGNENILIGLDPMARSENTIRVSAVQPDRAKASFSNYGDYSTVSAPGVQIYNAIPNDNYAFFEGTSMASPIVAGGCALLKSKDPDMSVTEAAGILRMTGIPSTSDVGPIVNFARALEADYGDVDECARVNERYNELLAELEELRRQYPGCIQQPDTLSIPEDMTVEQLDGRWKSTTSLYNEQDEEVVIYFTFNGTPVARLDIVEPSGEIYTAVLAVSVSGDQIFIDQQKPAYCQSNGKGYNPYRFVLRPDRNRKAVGNAKNKVEIANAFNFNLIKI